MKVDHLSVLDIYTMSEVVGAIIEDQVVATLNRLRDIWDDGNYKLYHFVRQPQQYPDVVLRKADPADPEVIIGIELKGWYLLAKEKMPNLRFKVTPAAINPWDLFVVVPWNLPGVLSGTPKAIEPYIEQSKYIAEYRNYWWQHIRKAQSDTTIKSPAVTASTYPKKSDSISDSPASDKGGNFGRIARIGVMDSYLNRVLDDQLCGIPVHAWIDFFLIFAGSESEKTKTIKNLDDLRIVYEDIRGGEPDGLIAAILDALRQSVTGSLES
jgi:hypothetical protein